MRRLDYGLQRERRQSKHGTNRKGRDWGAAPVGELPVVDLELQRVHRLLELRLEQPAVEALAALNAVVTDPLEPLVFQSAHVVVHAAAR